MLRWVAFRSSIVRRTGLAVRHVSAVVLAVRRLSVGVVLRGGLLLRPTTSRVLTRKSLFTYLRLTSVLVEVLLHHRDHSHWWSHGLTTSLNLLTSNGSVVCHWCCSSRTCAVVSDRCCFSLTFVRRWYRGCGLGPATERIGTILHSRIRPAAGLRRRGVVTSLCCDMSRRNYEGYRNEGYGREQ